MAYIAAWMVSKLMKELWNVSIKVTGPLPLRINLYYFEKVHQSVIAYEPLL